MFLQVGVVNISPRVSTGSWLCLQSKLTATVLLSTSESQTLFFRTESESLLVPLHAILW